MRVKQGIPKFRADHIRSFWESKIIDLASLIIYILGLVLVDFDTEVSRKTIHKILIAHEIGISFLVIDD
jgi:hypothetical protein